MSQRTFYVTYLDEDDRPLFSEMILAEDYWAACTYALHDNARGAKDFTVIDPEAPETGSPPFTTIKRKAGSHRRSRKFRSTYALPSMSEAGRE